MNKIDIMAVKTYLQLILISVILILLIYVVRSYNGNDTWSEEQIEINIGGVYLYNDLWDIEDPFHIPKIDTILIIDKKSDYVQYRKISNDFLFSRPESHLIKDCKKLK